MLVLSSKLTETEARELKRGEILVTGMRTHSPTVSPILDQQAAAVTNEGEHVGNAAANGQPRDSR